MKNPTYYNGVISPYDSTAIPLSDRSIFFGDAVYEVMIGRGEKIYQFKEHFARLAGNCSAIGLNINVTPEELRGIIGELISLAGTAEFTVYVQVSGNSIRRAHARDEEEGNLLVSLSEINVPREANRIKAITRPDLRYKYCNLKTVNLLPAVLSMNNAKRANADISIFHRGQTVTECSHANIAILKNGRLKTPPLSKSILPGITRATLLDVCADVGVGYVEERLTVSELFSADAVITSSTTKLLQLCTEIDGYKLTVADGETVKRLFDALHCDFLSKTK